MRRAASLLILVLGACGDSVTSLPLDASADQMAPDMAPADLGLPDAALADQRAPDTFGGPTVTAVEDEGHDGTAVVGERVWLHGTQFGTGCVVRFAAVEAPPINVSQLDLLFQVPEGVDVGAQTPVLHCDNGDAPFALQVLRYHLVTLPSSDAVALLKEEVPRFIEDTKARLTLNEPDAVALSHDSAVAYVARAAVSTGTPQVSLVDLTASGGPILLAQKLPYAEPVVMPVFGLGAAADAPVLAVAAGLYVVLYDISDPRQPQRTGLIQLVSLTSGQPLPELKAGFFTRVALSPDGKRAAILDGAADELLIYDISRPEQPQLLFPAVKVSGGTSIKPIIQLPLPVSVVLGQIKIQGGSSQDLAISADGSQAAVLAGGGVGALAPESFNIDLHNSTVSVVDMTTGSYRVKLLKLPQAHLPNNLGYTPAGALYVTTLSSASGALIKLLFQIGVAALISGGLDLMSIGSILFTNFGDVVDIVKATWNGTLFHFGGLYRVDTAAPSASFRAVPYVQGGLCSTHDSQRLLVASQGWNVDLRLDGLDLLKSFKVELQLGASVHNTTTDTLINLGLFPWQAKMLLPPWSFGQAACQR